MFEREGNNEAHHVVAFFSVHLLSVFQVSCCGYGCSNLWLTKNVLSMLVYHSVSVSQIKYYLAFQLSP